MNEFLTYSILGITIYKLLQAILIIIMALFAQTIFHTITNRMFKAHFKSGLPKVKNDDLNKRIKTLSSLLGTVITFAIWFVAIVVILGIFGVPTAALITSAGLIGAALAFGLQSIIKDFISGVFIISENQYRIGDYVILDKTAGSSQVPIAGIVQSISVRATVLKTADGSLLYIPNGSITNTSNYSMGSIKVFLNLELKSSYSITKLNAALTQIATTLQESPNLTHKIIEGPKLFEISNITGKTASVQVVFKTNHSYKTNATNAVWQAIQKSTIELQA